jgi:hypothetical protein
MGPRVEGDMARIVWLIVVAVLLGCTKRIEVPELTPVHIVDPNAAWARVLSEHVSGDGRINFSGLRQDPADLEQFVAYVARVGPGSSPSEFPTGEDELAHYINVYNALAMFVALRGGDPSRTAQFFDATVVTVDGKELSLNQVVRTLVRPAEDPRALFTLHCVSVSCPVLSNQPYEGGRLEAQLQKAAESYFNDERNVKVDADAKTIHLPALLDDHQVDLLRSVDSLVGVVNKYRGEKVPDGLAVQFMEHDWTLSLWADAPQQTGP